MRRFALALALVAAPAAAQVPSTQELPKICVVSNWSDVDAACSATYLDCGAFLVTDNASQPGRGNIVWCNPADSLNDLIGPSTITGLGAYSFGGSGAANYSQTFTNETTVVLTHNLGTDNLIIQCHADDDTLLGTDSMSYARSAPFDATVTFSESQSGRCIVNGLQNAGRHIETFSAQTTLTITAATHGLGTNAINVSCFDDSAPPERVEPDRVSIGGIDLEVIITFHESETGKCVLQ